MSYMLFLALEVIVVDNLKIMHLRFFFCNDFAIEYKFSSPRTPQQNGVVERNDRSIKKKKLVKTTLIKHHLNNTLYELWKYRKLNIS